MSFAPGKKSGPVTGLLIVSLLTLLLAAACSSHKIVATSPQALFNKAEKAYQDGSLTKANELFQAVQNEFPDTEFARLALLRTADIAYRKVELTEAARTYNDFINFNEDHPRAPYAYYQAGMCHYQKIDTLDRDLTPLKLALDTFQEALAKYPDSPPYTEKIIQRINDCKRRFAKREFYVGFFYYKQKKFTAAIGRFKYLLEHYPGYIDDKALYYLGLAQMNNGKIDQGHRSLLILCKGFPQSPYAAQARPLLKQDKGPGVPLMFMARDYFLLRQEDIHDQYITSEFQPENYAPRFFNLFSRAPEGKKRAEEITFASLYRPLPGEAGEKKKETGPESGPEKRGKAAAGKPGATAAAAGAGAGKAVGQAPQAPRRQARLGRQDEPLEIISDWTEADREKGTISFGGKVIAKQKDMVLYADKVVNYFDMNTRRLIKAIAVGNVKLNQADKFATCEKAELVQADRKVILTGNPVMWQGENRVSGDRIIIYLNDKQAEVFGGPKKKATIKITPGKP